MWSSSRVLRNGVVGVLLLGGTLGLAGCSFTPVYSDGGVGAGLRENAFAYAKPTTRLEQIIYQELILRFGKAQGIDAPTVHVKTGASSRDLTRSFVVRPSDQKEATVSAAISIVAADGSVVYTGTRSAAALYSVNGQVFADTEAEKEAYERAARELAETIRLTLLGALGKPVAG